MKRTMFQVYVTGCDDAIELYRKAFQGTVDAVYRHPETGKIEHAEMTAFGQCIAFSESPVTSSSGSTMQFCFHFGEGHEAEVQRAYEVLKEGAKIESPMGPVEWSPCMFSLIDSFGVNWCLFV